MPLKYKISTLEGENNKLKDDVKNLKKEITKMKADKMQMMLKQKMQENVNKT